MGHKTLRQWRHRLGVTQQELTQKAGVSIATIVLVERYGHKPGCGVRSRLSKALGISESEIWPEIRETNNE